MFSHQNIVVQVSEVFDAVLCYFPSVTLYIKEFSGLHFHAVQYFNHLVCDLDKLDIVLVVDCVFRG